MTFIFALRDKRYHSVRTTTGCNILSIALHQESVIPAQSKQTVPRARPDANSIARFFRITLTGQPVTAQQKPTRRRCENDKCGSSHFLAKSSNGMRAGVFGSEG